MWRDASASLPTRPPCRLPSGTGHRDGWHSAASPAPLRNRGTGQLGAGFALPAALLMILLIAALIAGVFSAITEETRIGVAAADRQHRAADRRVSGRAHHRGVVGRSRCDRIGETRSRPVDGLAVPVMVYVTRLDSSRYWLVADAGSASPNSGIARRVGVVVRATRWADRFDDYRPDFRESVVGAFLGPCQPTVTFPAIQSCLSTNVC